MVLQTLLMSKDDLAAETLIRVLAEFGVAVDRSTAVDVAATRLAEERFDQVIVDFDDPDSASQMLEACRRLAGPDRNPPVTVALLPDATRIRSILGAGAHFILTKPVAFEQAQNTLRAATALLMRERRESTRVTIQAAISIHPGDGSSIEGILLDLSAGGLDVLVAKPVPSDAVVRVSFELPDSGARIEGQAEVAWSNANGQVGMRFLDMDASAREQMDSWLAAHSQDALPENHDTVGGCKLTDLSLGGCYVQTVSPFPQSSAVDLCLRAAGMEIHTEGLVRIMHPAHGMGIAFPAGTEEQRKSVGRFIDFLTGQPGVSPQLEISPRCLVAPATDLSTLTAEEDGSGESEDPLLELLRTGDSLDEEEFLNALQRQRTPMEVGQ